MNEKIIVEDYVNVREQARKLGCNIPESLALLPRNFEKTNSKEELIHEGEIDTVRKLWKQNNIVETPIEKDGERYPHIAEHAFTWIGPTVLISSTIIIQNPYLISITLNVLSNYLTDWFKGISKNNQWIKLSYVIETKSESYKKLSYQGDLEGLKQLPKIIKEINDEQRS